MKWITVSEMAKIEGLTIQAIYKRIREGRIKSERKFGKLVVWLGREQVQEA